MWNQKNDHSSNTGYLIYKISITAKADGLRSLLNYYMITHGGRIGGEGKGPCHMGIFNRGFAFIAPFSHVSPILFHNNTSGFIGVRFGSNDRTFGSGFLWTIDLPKTSSEPNSAT